MGDRGLEAVHEKYLQGVRRPGRLFLGPLLLGIPPVRGAQVAQKQIDFGKGTLTDVCADAEHGSDGGMRDIMAQVNQREQHFLEGKHLAGTSAADGPAGVRAFSAAPLPAGPASRAGRLPTAPPGRRVRDRTGHGHGLSERLEVAEGSCHNLRQA